MPGTSQVALPSATWTKVSTGDAEYNFSAPQDVLYWYAPSGTPPTSTDRGHFLAKGTADAVVLTLGYELWLYNPHPFGITAQVTQSW